MKKPYLLLFTLTFFTLSLSAQSDRFKKKNKKPEPSKQEEPAKTSSSAAPAKPARWSDNLVYGGGAGLSFGTNTNVFLSPQVGYKFSDRLIAGIGYMYNYVRIREAFNGVGFERVDFTNQVHGPNLFTSYSFLEKAFVGAQFEVLNHDLYTYNFNQGNFDINNNWTPVFFLQAGYYVPIGRKGFMQLGLRLNVLHDNDSPYGTSWTPLLQVYF
jgi:hypothetical protein